MQTASLPGTHAPRGCVTVIFFLTDIQDSAHLWQQPAATPAALARHHNSDARSTRP
jgi:hypothetical protein